MADDGARGLARRVELAEALDMAAFATELAEVVPELGATTFPFVDGHAVLCGAGMFVNGPLGVGFERVPTEDEFDQWEAACAERGVTANFEVHEFSHPDLVEAVESRGYVRDPDSERTGLTLTQSDYSPRAVAEGIDVVHVTTPELLAGRLTRQAPRWFDPQLGAGRLHPSGDQGDVRPFQRFVTSPENDNRRRR
jgi:hypothetical protein